MMLEIRQYINVDRLALLRKIADYIAENILESIVNKISGIISKLDDKVLSKLRLNLVEFWLLLITSIFFVNTNARIVEKIINIFLNFFTIENYLITEGKFSNEH